MDDTVPKPVRRRDIVALFSVTLILFVSGIVLVGWFTWFGIEKLGREYLAPEFEHAILWDNEILYPQSTEPPLDLRSIGIDHGPFRMMALNPHSGTVRATPIILEDRVYGVLANQDRLWIICPSEVVETGPSSGVHHHTLLKIRFRNEESDRARNQRKAPDGIIGFNGPFLLDDNPAIIAMDADERFWVYTFQNDEWIRGQQIALPTNGQYWTIDEATNRQSLSPRAINAENPDIDFLKSGSDLILFTQVPVPKPLNNDFPDSLCISSHIGIWRKGLEFLPETPPMPSAIMPENAPAEASGWKSVADFDGELSDEMEIRYRKKEFLKRHAELDQIKPDSISLYPVANSGDRMLVCHKRFETLVLEKTSKGYVPISPPFVTAFNRFHRQFFHNDSMAYTGFFAVSMISIGYCLRGARRLDQHSKLPFYQFGHTRKNLAPVSKRFAARSIDLLLQWFPLFCILVAILFPLNSLPSFVVSPTSIVYSFSKVTLATFSLSDVYQIFQELAKEALRWSGYLQIAFVWSMSYVMLTAVLQGIRGYSPGKYLTGIRTMQSTLRPCGIARSLLRELMIYVDMLGYLCPFPAIASMLLNRQRQRWGDILADTIVIDAS